MKVKKKWAVIGLLILTISVIVLLKLLSGVEVEVAEAQKTTVENTVVEKGRVVGRDNVDLLSEVQGKVKGVYVEEGEHVKNGKVMAKIDVPELESQIAQLEGELKVLKGNEAVSEIQDYQNKIKQQEIALQQALVDLELAEAANRRAHNLYEEEAITLSELEKAEAELETAKKDVEEIKAELGFLQEQDKSRSLIYQGQKESLEAKLKFLLDQKSKATITAITGGTVLAKNVKIGDFVTVGTPLFTLGKTDNVEIEAYISSRNAMNINKGEKVSVLFKLAGTDIETEGEIYKIAPTAEEKMSALGTIEDKVKVTILLKDWPDKLHIIPGTVVDVTFVIQRAVDVVSIPKDSVFMNREDKYVWVVKNKKANPVQIETGIEGDDLIEVKKGLNQGDTVIINPYNEKLRPRIKIKERES